MGGDHINNKAIIEKKIPVVFASNNDYVKYLSVTILSFLVNNVKNELYIYIFHRDISEENQRKLIEMVENRGGWIRLVNVKDYIIDNQWYIDGRITIESYYRILVPVILKEWDKVLYYDVDVVCNSDLNELYDLEIGESWIAGVVAQGNDNRAEYCREHLGISSDTYIYAGGIIFNNKVLREIEWLDICMTAMSEKGYFKWHDMDLLNMVCFGHIYYMNPKWNMTVGYLVNQKKVSDANALTLDMIDCYVIHYATAKPWLTEINDVNTFFWKYVNESPFGSEIIAAYRCISDTKVHFCTLCQEGCVSLLYILKCLMKASTERVERLLVWRKR